MSKAGAAAQYIRNLLASRSAGVRCATTTLGHTAVGRPISLSTIHRGSRSINASTDTGL